MITQEQLDIALLKQKNEFLYNTFIDSNIRISQSTTDIKESIRDVKSEMKSQFHWMMGSISVLYISLLGTLVTALAKSLHWF